MRTHGYHWFDKGWLANEPHASPIRKGALLYNIFNTRTEGFATGWEEMMLQAGMFDARPRSRELIYILVGQRAPARSATSECTANEFTLEQAAAVRVREHAARLAQPRGQPGARRAAPLPPAAGLRHELRDRQDRNGEAHR